MKENRRVLCAREFQNSISESVHRVLADTIRRNNWESVWEIQDKRILGSNGSGFFFEGIKNNPQRIKSYEGITDCWVEEADLVSENSWDILIPTIFRNAGAEMWITFNPSSADTYTYRHFVMDPPRDSVVMFMNYLENEWLPQAQLDEAEDMKRKDYEKYLNIWLGRPRRVLSGAIYAREIQIADAEDRLRTVRYAPEYPVDTFWDLGRRDNTGIWFVQHVAGEYRVLRYLEDSGKHISDYVKALRRLGYNYGGAYLPHDAKARRLIAKRTIEEEMRQSKLFSLVRVLPRESIANGINAARTVFPQCVFDERNCKIGLDHLGKYSYEVTDGVKSQQPKHDEHSHAADAWRTLAMSNVAGRVGTKRLDAGLERQPFAGREMSPEGRGWLTV